MVLEYKDEWIKNAEMRFVRTTLVKLRKHQIPTIGHGCGHLKK